MRNVLFVKRPVVQVALIIVLLAVVAVVFTRAQDYAGATLDTATYNTLRAYGVSNGVYNTLRVYGRDSEGAGDESAFDLEIEPQRRPEDPPYTDSEPVFNPQLSQAPRKDSITWNPLWMYAGETFDENQHKGLYQEIKRSGLDASEKVWFRMWYEPEHWDKDLNATGYLDRDPITGEPTDDDEWYPAIMQEFTYLLTLRGVVDGVHPPAYGLAGGTSFVFPVGMRAEDLFITDTWAIDFTSDHANWGFGLTSFDGNFDGVLNTHDIVHLESEATLVGWTGISTDFDGDGNLDPLDDDGDELQPVCGPLQRCVDPQRGGGDLRFPVGCVFRPLRWCSLDV